MRAELKFDKGEMIVEEFRDEGMKSWITEKR